MNIRMLATAGALAGIACAAVVSTHTAPVSAQTIAQVRPDGASDRNLRGVRHRLEGLIDQLQHDQSDYGGHRLKALADLQQARAEIVAALGDDRGH